MRDKATLRLAAFATAFAIAPVYLLTMARQVGFVDRGEMAAVAATLGIAHPTGYPTLTLLGHLATRLLPAHPLAALNTLAALLVAASAAALTVLFDRVLRAIEVTGAARVPAGARAVLAMCTASGLGLSATWWQQANGFEAYALHALTLPLALEACLAWCGVGEPSDAPRFGARRGLWFGLMLGLAFTAHMTVGLLGPALLCIAIGRGALRADTARRLWPVVPGLLIGLSPYAYLPLRAAQHPRFNWGDPETIGRFIAHVSGAEFRGWMWSNADTYRRQLGYLATHLPWDLTWIGLVLASAGAAVLLLRDRVLGVTVLLIAFAGVLYAGGYQIRDIDSYFMAVVLACGIAAAAALHAMAARWGMRVAFALVLPWLVASMVTHVRPCDERDNTMARDLATDLLTPLPPGSVLWTSQWDYALSASYWLQEVEGVRRDVTVASPALMRFAWYLDELERRAPGLMLPATTELAAYRTRLTAAEAGPPVAPDSLRAACREAIRSLIARGAPGHTFVTSDVGPELTAGFERVPIGLARQLVRDTAYVSASPPQFTFRSWPNRVDAYLATSHWIYGEALVARAQYELAHGRAARSRQWAEAARAFDPHLDWRRIPPQPFDGRELVLQSIGFFAELERALGTPAAPAQRP